VHTAQILMHYLRKKMNLTADDHSGLMSVAKFTTGMFRSAKPIISIPANANVIQ